MKAISSVKFKRIRQLVWLYFWLLIFEGALRRWFLPFLSTPLLLVRDPIALLAVFWSWPLLCQSRWWLRVQIILWFVPIAFFLAVYFGHGDWFTALYGCRIFAIHLPLIFVIGLVFNQQDVTRFSWIMLLLCIPMVVLIVFQSISPPDHILNVGPGGTGSAAFDGAGGKFRPPGTFSFTTGVASFFTLSMASLMSIQYGRSRSAISNVKKTPLLQLCGYILCLIAALAIVIAQPVSISRALLANYMIVILSTFVVLMVSRSQVVSLFSGLLILALLLGIATTIPAVNEASKAFALRWELAANSGTGKKGNDKIAHRVLDAYAGPLENLHNYPLLGHGIGMGTNIGAVRLTGGQIFLLDERSWGRQLGELGLFLGLIFIGWRVSFAFWLLSVALKAAIHMNKMPLIFVGVSFSEVLGGQLGQPTGLGFLVMSAGLTLSSIDTSSMFDKDMN